MQIISETKSPNYNQECSIYLETNLFENHPFRAEHPELP